MKKVNGHEVITLFEQWAPKRFAEDWDPVGLHIGQLNRAVEKVLVTLDVNEQVVDEAIAKGVQMILAHHPLIFRPMKSIPTDTPQGRIIEKCVKYDIAVYAAHTNLDVAQGGVNDLLAQQLQLQQVEVMAPTYSESLYKLAVYCPVHHADRVRQALADAGAGAIGNYVGCSFSTRGTGRFTPQQEAQPYIGQAGKEEAVEEECIEVVLPSVIRTKVLKALLKAHPYEEPAYDLYALDQQTNMVGLGRVGRLEEEMTLQQFAEKVKQAFNVSHVSVTGALEQTVQKVAVLGGSGAKYMQAAKRKGADVFVTGDIDFHSAQDAAMMGLMIVDPGHHVEKVMIQGVVTYMSKACQRAGFAVDFLPSTVNTNPFQII